MIPERITGLLASLSRLERIEEFLQICVWVRGERFVVPETIVLVGRRGGVTVWLQLMTDHIQRVVEITGPSDVVLEGDWDDQERTELVSLSVPEKGLDVDRVFAFAESDPRGDQLIGVLFFLGTEARVGLTLSNFVDAPMVLSGPAFWHHLSRELSSLQRLSVWRR